MTQECKNCYHEKKDATEFPCVICALSPIQWETKNRFSSKEK